MKRLLLGLSAFATSLLGGLCACNSTNACTGVSCFPTVTIKPEPPISQAGDYEVDFVADGMKMTCTLTVPSTAPADCTDQRAYVAQKSGEGITFMSVDGDSTYSTVSVTVKRDGETIAAQTFSSLKYENADFTGAGCPSCPAVSKTLRVGTVGEEPDASSKPAPDASVSKMPDASVMTAKDAAAPAHRDAAIDAH
jgi:hypothetical protein